MNAVEHVPVAIQDDFIERQTRAQPIAALAELIWNSLDGEASRVDVEFERSDLACGLSKIVVYDDGEAFPRSEAAKLFGNLGGSWKRLTRRTRVKSRMVHGQEGRGRYNGKRFGKLKTAMGHDGRKVFHSIRKTVATILENKGAPENVVTDIVGHEKPTMTYGLYSGGAEIEAKQKTIDKLEYPT